MRVKSGARSRSPTYEPKEHPVQNVEFKAELRDLALARSIAIAIGATFEATLEQTDTYYRAADVRFKKRETVVRPGPGPPGRISAGATSPPEYILYTRADRTRPKISCYEILSQEGMKTRFGEAPLTPWVVVVKTRELYMFQSVRLHLDIVQGLGEFIEFEAIVSPAQNVAACHDSIGRLRQHFHPALGEPISCSYADLVGARE